MPSVNPTILRWARETAGLSLDEAAKRAGLNDAHGVSAAQRLAALEAGQADPSRAVLYKMAALYRRPLVAFYMATPPVLEARIEDYRTLPDREAGSEPLLQALVRDVRARQAIVRALLEEEEAQPLPFVGSCRMAAGIDAVAAALSRDLQFRLDAFRAAGNVDQAFAYLRARAEAVGVFVLLIGDLGSHHTELDTDAFRGFALSDPIAPFVVLNDRDARSAWAFTLLHELAHIWLGASGISGAHPEGAIERFCNEVATRILLPPTELPGLGIDTGASLPQMAAMIGAAATPLRVSRSLIAYRLYQSGAINLATWTQLSTLFRDEWRAQRARRKESRSGPGGPDYYVVRRQRLGAALVGFVERMVREGLLSPTKAGRVLGVRPRSVEPLISGRAA